MFQLAEIRHMVRIPPWLFGQTLNDAVIEELNRKLANKVSCTYLTDGLKCFIFSFIIGMKEACLINNAVPLCCHAHRACIIFNLGFIGNCL